jgi:CBS domain containing-hemolysin-like protein
VNGAADTIIAALAGLAAAYGLQALALAEGALSLDTRHAEQVTIPWEQVVTVSPRVAPAYLERLVAQTGFTRFPVAGEHVDRYVHAKAALAAETGAQDRPLPEQAFQPLPAVSPATPLSQVLTLMRTHGVRLRTVRDGG